MAISAPSPEFRPIRTYCSLWRRPTSCPPAITTEASSYSKPSAVAASPLLGHRTKTACGSFARKMGPNGDRSECHGPKVAGSVPSTTSETNYRNRYGNSGSPDWNSASAEFSQNCRSSNESRYRHNKSPRPAARPKPRKRTVSYAFTIFPPIMPWHSPLPASPSTVPPSVK